MASLKMIFALLAVILAAVSASPVPGGWGGGWGGSHKHVVIHVPYHVHTVHHHHVKKVHVPVPVVKKIYIHEEPEIHHHDPWW